jgi:putative restriction endonuclease
MRLRIAVTDNDWFRYLRSLPDVDEVNFWQPSGGRAFRALSPSELLLFKLHHPENYIVGGGFFVRYLSLPYTYVWDAFGPKSGAPTQPHDPIGCILLRDPFFLDEFLWIEAPADFAANIVQGKTYEEGSPTGRLLWEQVQIRLPAVFGQVAAPVPEEEPAMWGEPALRRQRLGQGTFRLLVTDNYQRRCAVTGEKALPVLDAAHIRPVTEGGQHRLDNGLLLRTDVHRLFDQGYVTVTPDGRFLVSRRLKDDFDNGEPYIPFNDKRIWVPGDPASQPDRLALEWHGDVRFLG